MSKTLDAQLEERLTSRGLLRYAWDYYKAFTDQHEKHPKDTDMYEVKYYLLCHSIELAMKAILRENGYTRRQLLDLGHDLEGLVKELNKNEVIMDVDTMVRTFTANQYYKTKQFEYPQTGYKELPSLDDMKDSTHLLLGLTSNKIEKLLPPRKK